jgi:hypothetical protein
VLLQEPGEGLAGKLGALVGVEYGSTLLSVKRGS